MSYLHKMWLPALVLLVCAALTSMARAEGGSSSNLIENADLSIATTNGVKGWTLVQAAPPRAIGGFGTENGNRYLFLKADTGASDNFWWVQKMPALPGQSYELRYQAQTSGQSHYNVYVGIEVFDNAGKWLTFILLRDISNANPNFPDATKPPLKEWTSFTDTFTLPPGTKTIGLRFALDAKEPSKASYRGFSLTRTANGSSTTKNH